MNTIPDVAPAVAEVPVIQQPPEVRTVYLGGLFLLAILAAVRIASGIVLPIVLAFILKLVLQPLLRLLLKLHLPKILAALIILLVLLSGIVALGTIVAGPAASWAEKLPAAIPKLQQRLGFLSHTIETAQKFMVRADDLAKGPGPEIVPVAFQGTRLSDKVFTGTRAFTGEFFTTVMVLFFLLASGDTFLRRLVEVLPRFKDKRQAVDISQQIEQHISIYLITITLLNAGVGLTTGIAMALYGLGDPVLWATLAFLLNYIPIIGPTIGVAIFLLVGLTVGMDGGAFLPAATYLAINVIEGTFITPMVLAKRFTLNPVLVILSLVFWYWMWGVPGAILAMPMLAITKIVCDRIQPLMPFGHFLEG